MSREQTIEDGQLQAYADGRLDDGARAAVEQWLTAHPEEAERLSQYKRIGEELHRLYDPVLDEPVPARLREGRWRPRFRGLARAAGWAILGLAIGALIGWEARSNWPGGAQRTEVIPFAHRAALAHATYSPEVRHPVEVGADQEAHLVAWLSKRVGVQLRAPKLDAEEFSLVGGRLLPGEQGPVAHFMYQCSNGRRLTLYVATPPAGNTETAFRYVKDGKVSVFYWVDRRLGYALSSADVERDELLRLANVVYKQLNP